MRNGWLQLRPKIDERRFVRVLDEPWAKDLRLGTHRLRQQWCDQRFDHLDSDGMPKRPKALKVNEDEAQADIEFTEIERVLDTWEEWLRQVSSKKSICKNCQKILLVSSSSLSFKRS